MIANYGYRDGSGTYFISVDSGKCDGCGRCVAACPERVFETCQDPCEPLEEKVVAVVSEEQRKKIKYACAACKPVSGVSNLPCLKACEKSAIDHSW